MSYPVGTICIGQNHVIDTERNGMECVITDEPRPRAWHHHDGTTGTSVLYEVEWADGTVSATEHRNLKRKSDYDKDKRAEAEMAAKDRDRQKVSKLIAACKKAAESAIEAGEKV